MTLWFCTMEIQFFLPSLESTAIIPFHLPASLVSWYKITNIFRQQRYLSLLSGSSQLWKSDGSILKSNANVWTHNDELEVEFKNEYILIRNSSSTKVLEARNESDLVEEDFEEGKDEQLWTRGENNTDGFFTLKNVKVQKYLTAVSKSILQVRGKYAMHNTSSYYSLGRVLLAEHVIRIFLRHNYEYGDYL